MRGVPLSARARWLPALALVLNALTWGVSWWPFRQLAAQGLHPLWATALIYAMAVLAITLEPLGGSPTGKPTGPVVASGALIKA